MIALIGPLRLSTGHDVSSSRQNTAMFIGGIPLIILGSFMQTCLGSAGLLFNDSASGHADEVRVFLSVTLPLRMATIALSRLILDLFFV